MRNSGIPPHSRGTPNYVRTYFIRSSTDLRRVGLSCRHTWDLSHSTYPSFILKKMPRTTTESPLLRPMLRKPNHCHLCPSRRKHPSTELSGVQTRTLVPLLPWPRQEEWKCGRGYAWCQAVLVELAICPAASSV